jgi:DNA-binding NtrC family response regulator
VRELENVLKRFVILQDEDMVLAELQRAKLAEPVFVPAGVAAMPNGVHAMPPPLREPPAERAPVFEDVAPPLAETTADTSDGDATPSKLPELARRAALSAEREAIQQALDRFRWNRRKAAQLLGVSYKTLLNKMKECGISAPNE